MMGGRDNRARWGDVAERELKEVVGSTRVVGGAFTLFGGFLVAWPVSRMRGQDALVWASVVTTLLVAPGMFYIVAGVFLQKRRYWAWVATTITTVVLLVAVLSLAVLVIVRMVRIGATDDVCGPMVGFGCWSGALGLILMSLRRCVRMVREEEAVVQKGFAVLPVDEVSAKGEKRC